MGKHPTYSGDNKFKASARDHQSEYREKILKLKEYDIYGNRLCESDGKQLLNYFEELEVRTVLRKRYPKYSKLRDGDMLRSEHLPFNLFAPLINRHPIAQKIVKSWLNIDLDHISRIEIEWPDSIDNPLGDHTALDTYIEGLNTAGRKIGIGVEVKYTEGAYRIGKSEKARIDQPDSSYWVVTKNSGCFLKSSSPELPKNDYRQIWRNQLLGLAFVGRGELDDFYSVTLFPKGNEHFGKTIPRYKQFLEPGCRDKLIGSTLEEFIESIPEEAELADWISYLKNRYLINSPI